MQAERNALLDSTDQGAAVRGGVTTQISKMDSANQTCRDRRDALVGVQQAVKEGLAHSPDTPERVDHCRSETSANRPDKSS